MSEREYQARHVACGLPFRECPCWVPRPCAECIEDPQECGDMHLSAEVLGGRLSGLVAHPPAEPCDCPCHETQTRGGRDGY